MKSLPSKADRPKAVQALRSTCCAGRAPGENGQLTRWSDLPGVEILRADFRRHAYLPHWHDTYTLALVEAGCERVHMAGAERLVSAGNVVLLNPGDIHDGEAHDPAIGWDFRVLYLSPAILSANTSSMDECGVREAVFGETLLHNPHLWRTLLTMHETLSRSNTLLDRTTSLFLGISQLAEYAVQDTKQRSAIFAPASLDRARQFLEANWADPVCLDDLACVAGLSRFHLLREFRRRYGLPPHAYQLQLRVLKAKDMLFAGMPASEVAATSGFYDQAHLTNVLKKYVGVSPGRITKQ